MGVVIRPYADSVIRVDELTKPTSPVPTVLSALALLLSAAAAIDGRRRRGEDLFATSVLIPCSNALNSFLSEALEVAHTSRAELLDTGDADTRLAAASALATEIQKLLWKCKTLCSMKLRSWGAIEKAMNLEDKFEAAETAITTEIEVCATAPSEHGFVKLQSLLSSEVGTLESYAARATCKRLPAS